MNHFERFRLPITYAVDLAALESAYRDACRSAHPDQHTARGAGEDPEVIRNAAEINEAYSVLRHPVRRAEYLLGLWGGPSASEERSMPPEFLEEVLELRMEIEEAKESSDSAALVRLEEDLRARRSRQLDGLALQFDQPNAAENRVAIRSRLNTVTYLDGLLRDLGD